MTDILVKCRCGTDITLGKGSESQRGELLKESSFDLIVDEAAEAIAELMQFEAEGRRQEWLLTRLGPEYPLDTRNADVVADVIRQGRILRAHAALQCSNCGTFFVAKAPSSWKAYWRLEPADAPSDMISRLG